jgi:hypothetical protein
MMPVVTKPKAFAAARTRASSTPLVAMAWRPTLAHEGIWPGRLATSAPLASEPENWWDAGASGHPDCCCEHAT